MNLAEVIHISYNRHISDSLAALCDYTTSDEDSNSDLQSGELLI